MESTWNEACGFPCGAGCNSKSAYSLDTGLSPFLQGTRNRPSPKASIHWWSPFFPIARLDPPKTVVGLASCAWLRLESNQISQLRVQNVNVFFLRLVLKLNQLLCLWVVIWTVGMLHTQNYHELVSRKVELFQLESTESSIDHFSWCLFKLSMNMPFSPTVRRTASDFRIL